MSAALNSYMEEQTEFLKTWTLIEPWRGHIPDTIAQEDISRENMLALIKDIKVKYAERFLAKYRITSDASNNHPDNWDKFQIVDINLYSNVSWAFYRKRFFVVDVQYSHLNYYN